MSGQDDPLPRSKPGLLTRLLGSTPKKTPATKKPAYYADGGALMGTVVDELEDESGNSTSYVVETDYGERMRFPVDQFEVTERGLIYRPLWKEALEKQVDELEERIRAGETGDSMVVARILNLDTVDPEAIKNLKAQHPEQSAIFEAFAGLIALYRELKQRMEVLEVERLRARSDLTLHAGERLLKHNSRREFAKLVLAERRRYQICDINIKHVRELLKRLYDSPYFPEKLFPPLDHDDPAGDDPLAQTSSPARPSSGAVRNGPRPPPSDPVREAPIQPDPKPASQPGSIPVLAAARPDGQSTGRSAGHPAQSRPATQPQAQPQAQAQPHGERGGPRVTFTPPPDQLRQGTQGSDGDRVNVAAEGPPPDGAGPSASDNRSPSPSMARPAADPGPASRGRPLNGASPSRPGPLASRNLDGQPLRRPGAAGGVASQFQGLINRSQAHGPMNTAAPGVANSMLSFVNEVSKGGRGQPVKPRRPQGAGQALVLNLGGQAQSRGRC